MSVAGAISALTRGAEPRTWSLIVTILGDLARTEGAAIPGPVLSLITGRLGVRPEAMRVALHRLRKDGWIVSQKDGRVSRYLLSAAGRVEAAGASGRIYADAPAVPALWHVLVARPMETGARLALDGALAAEGYVVLTPGTWLGAGLAPGARDGFFALEGKVLSLPDWLRAELMPEDLAAAYAEFGAALCAADAALGPGDLGALGDLDRAALRVLVVHGWRRLVLRHPDLPDGFFPDDWAGPAARTRVQRLLGRLGTPSLAEIAEAAEA